MKLPESWREVSLPQISELVGGGTPDRSIDSYFGGDIPWITPSDVTKLNGYWIAQTKERLTAEGLKNSPTKIVPPGSVLMATRVAVGKTAIAEVELATNQDFTSLVIDPRLVSSEYLARAIESHARLLESRSQGSTIKGIPRATVARLQLPLPTLPEQQRIVDLISQANAVSNAKQSVSDLIDRLIRTAYWQHFGDWYTADGLRDPVRIADYLSDTQYGVSEAMEERGTHAVLRMNSLTTSGWLDLSDLKYANLTKKDADNTQLKHGDLIFNRTNSKELVGKCAIWRETPGLFSFASYLVRLRLRAGMLPEYLWATLNSAYGKYRLLNTAKQAVSMANVSPTDLGRITVPMPPLEMQEKFAQFVRQVESLRADMLEKLDAFDELRNLVAQQALIGELTTDWRDQHRAEITAAAQTRDALLRERGAKLAAQPPEPALTPPKEKTELSHRHWLLSELSDFQRAVLAGFLAYDGHPLLAEVPDEFDRFRESEALGNHLAAFPSPSPNFLRRTLSQLAALGLIAKVSLPRTNPTTREQEFLTAFRPLRPGEQTRAADVATLRRSLGRDANPSDEDTPA